MSFDFDITNDVDLGGGYRLLARGYTGTGTTTEPDDYLGATARSASASQSMTDLLATAMERAEMREEQAIELNLVPEITAQPTRSAAYGDAIILEAPDLGEDRGQLVMLTDEDGAITFHFPVASEDDQSIQGPSVRGVGQKKVFIIPADVPPADETAGIGTRSLASAIGRKVLQILTFPIVRAAGRLIGEPLVRWWEDSNRAYGVRWFLPDNYRTRPGPDLSDADWGRLDGRRSLLFVHGTFSTSAGGFGGMPPGLMADLAGRYGDRVFAFNHPSLSATPIDNVGWFLDQIPRGVELDLDVIAHSRGGLVARVLAGGGPSAGLDLSGVRVGSVVCAGTPNYGTPLADPDHLSALCDRLATAANLIPGFPAGDIVDVLMLLVQYLAQGVLVGLRGLEVMNPNSDFLGTFNAGSPSEVSFHGIAANYEPAARGMKRVVAGAKDIGIDAVFEGADNDLVVPTLGVSTGASVFTIPNDEMIRFDKTRGVMHSTFWREPEVAREFLRWLTG